MLGDEVATRTQSPSAIAVKRAFETTEEDDQEEVTQRVRTDIDADGDVSISCSDTVNVGLELAYALAEDQISFNPWRPMHCAVTEEPEIFVGEAGGWTEDGCELPREKVLAGRSKELHSWHSFKVVTQLRKDEIPKGAKNIQYQISIKDER